MKKTTLKNIYIIYTGGTIGMRKYADGYAPAPGLLEKKLSKLSFLNDYTKIPNYVINSYTPLIDSSDMNIDIINRIGRDIYENYDKYDGFIVLHGTDTMAYTASALSFMFTNLTKPIILTGAQESIVGTKSDSESNLLNSLYFVINFSDIHEVCICFGGKLLRGNRTIKFSTKNHDAFLTPNYPVLHEITDDTANNKNGVVVTQSKTKNSTINFCELTNNYNIDVLYLFPGFSRNLLQKRLSSLQALVIVSYGLGNAPTDSSFLKILSKASQGGKILAHTSQCPHNLAQPSIYKAGIKFERAGVTNLYDMTLSAAIFKILYLNSSNLFISEIRQKLQENLRGEISDKNH